MGLFYCRLYWAWSGVKFSPIILIYQLRLKIKICCESLSNSRMGVILDVKVVIKLEIF